MSQNGNLFLEQLFLELSHFFVILSVNFRTFNTFPSYFRTSLCYFSRNFAFFALLPKFSHFFVSCNGRQFLLKNRPILNESFEVSLHNPHPPSNWPNNIPWRGWFMIWYHLYLIFLTQNNAIMTYYRDFPRKKRCKMRKKCVFSPGVFFDTSKIFKHIKSFPVSRQTHRESTFPQKMLKNSCLRVS